MGLIARYKTWKVMHLLNRIPHLLSKERFEESDRLLEEASRVYDALPDNVKRQKMQIEDLFFEMKKLLGGEFRRKLDRQLNSERFSRIAPPVITSRMNVAYGANAAKNFLVKTRRQIKNEKVNRSLGKMNNAVTERFSAKDTKDKLDNWKKLGYDTSIVEKQFGSRRTENITHPKKVHTAVNKIVRKTVQKSVAKKDAVLEAKINDLKKKIEDWKIQGYDTKMLEKQMESIRN